MKAKFSELHNDNYSLLITYRHEGQVYSDRLRANEIAVTRDWLDKVLKVEVQPRPRLPHPWCLPVTFEGQPAKDYVQGLNKTSLVALNLPAHSNTYRMKNRVYKIAIKARQAEYYVSEAKNYPAYIPKHERS
ncbi:MAG: hypothetical protein V4543_12335 [Bacteroidota bacterium]